MKKILILFIGCMILSSCYSNGTEPVNSDGISRDDLFAKRFTYDGHVYVEFKDEGLYGHGFTHDPECLLQDIDSIIKK